MENYLFVYGTLMSGFDNPFASVLRATSTLVGEGFFAGKLYRVSWYPGAVYLPKSECRVYGEIYLLHDFESLILRLDEYEDVLEDETKSLYLRKSVPVQQPNGTQLRCWTYLYNQPLQHLPLVESGRFSSR